MRDKHDSDLRKCRSRCKLSLAKLEKLVNTETKRSYQRGVIHGILIGGVLLVAGSVVLGVVLLTKKPTQK